VNPFQYRITDFSGGLNTQQSPYLINDNQAAYCRNVDFDGTDAGALKKRAGTTKLTSTAVTGTSVVGVNSVYRAWYSDATSIIIAAAGAQTYTYSAGSGFGAVSTGYTANKPFGFCMYNSLAIYGNAYEATKKMTSTASEASLGGSPPNGNLFASWKNRVWISGNTSYPNRLYFSALNNEADWTTSGDAGNIDIVKDDGDYITAIMPQGNRMLIFKQNSIYALSWSSPQSSSVDLAASGIGCIAPYSVTSVDGRVIFLFGGAGRSAGVYAIDQNNGLIHLSEPITPTIEESTLVQMQTAAGARYKHSYWLAIRNPSVSTYAYNNCVYVCNLNTGAWSQYTGVNVNHFYSDTRLGTNRLLGAGSDAAFVYIPDNGTDDNGSAIDFAWRSKSFAFSMPERRKCLEEVHVMAKTQTATVTINCYVNGSDSSWNQGLQFGGGSNAIAFKSLGVTDTASNGNVWALEFKANNTGSVTIHAASLYGVMEELGENGQ
jgi:hypothetical protein